MSGAPGGHKTINGLLYIEITVTIALFIQFRVTKRSGCRSIDRNRTIRAWSHRSRVVTQHDRGCLCCIWKNRIRFRTDDLPLALVTYESRQASEYRQCSIAPAWKTLTFVDVIKHFTHERWLEAEEVKACANIRWSTKFGRYYIPKTLSDTSCEFGFYCSHCSLGGIADFWNSKCRSAPWSWSWKQPKVLGSASRSTQSPITLSPNPVYGWARVMDPYSKKPLHASLCSRNFCGTAVIFEQDDDQWVRWADKIRIELQVVPQTPRACTFRTSIYSSPVCVH